MKVHSNLFSLSNCGETIPIYVGSYVILKLLPIGRKTAHTCYFVGKVLSGSRVEGWQVKCMRRHRSALNQFVYPLTNDIDTYSSDDIVKVLTPLNMANVTFCIL
jgi:hypothetical protein